jgi:hypothetical protein
MDQGMTAMKRWGRATGAALCLVCALTSQLSAQSKRDVNEYQRTVKQALHEYDLGNFAEAKAFFTQAHAMSPNARTLRGLGMSSYELRTYVEAIGYFEQALSSTEHPLTPQMRDEVSQLLRQARTFVTKLKVTLEPSSAELRVDTRPVSRDDQGFVLLDPGVHELVAEAPARETATRSLRTEGGEELSLTISLRTNTPSKAETTNDASEAGGTNTPVFQQPETQAAPVAATSSQSSLGPWILIGSGAAVAITGGVLLGVMASDKSKVEHAPVDSNYAAYKSAEQRVFPLSVIGFVAAGVGVAAVIGGVVWKVAADGGTRETANARLEVLPGGVRLAGQF